MSDFVGSGIAFPMRTDATGSLALVSRHQEIEEAVRLILGTARGERPMRPEFGCGIHDHVFAPADAMTAGMVAYEVREALGRWEPRIDVEEVDVEYGGDHPEALFIDLRYRIKETNDSRNLVFPFYVIPTEPD